MTKEEKLKAVASVAASLNRTYESKLVQKLGKGKAAQRIPCLSLGLPTIDEDVLGCGGHGPWSAHRLRGAQVRGRAALAITFYDYQRTKRPRSGRFVR